MEKDCFDVTLDDLNFQYLLHLGPEAIHFFFDQLKEEGESTVVGLELETLLSTLQYNITVNHDKAWCPNI